MEEGFIFITLQVISGVVSGLLLALITYAIKKIMESLKINHDDIKQMHRVNSMQLNAIKTEIGIIRESSTRNSAPKSGSSDDLN